VLSVPDLGHAQALSLCEPSPAPHAPPNSRMLLAPYRRLPADPMVQNKECEQNLPKVSSLVHFGWNAYLDRRPL